LFPNIQLHLYSKPNWCTELCDIVCVEEFLTLSVQYAQPCSQVAFAGQLGLQESFTVNVQSGQTLPVVVYNPEAALVGRRWTDVNQTSLTNIAVQYRSAGSSLESDWLPAINAATDEPVAPLYDQTNPPSTDGDYYQFAWAVAALNGNFELRAATTCVLQGGNGQSSLAATDPSLLSYSTPAIAGRIDYEPPQLMSYSSVLVLNNYDAQSLLPGPSSSLYYPGFPLTLTFNEQIVCISSADELLITAYASPSSQPNAAAISAAPTFTFVSYCEGNGVAFTFDPTTTALTKLVQQYVTITVTGLTDLVGNSPNPAYPLQFVMHVGSWTASQAAVSSSSTSSLSAALRKTSSSSTAATIKKHSSSSSSTGSSRSKTQKSSSSSAH
jgi:hypothetical protein